MSSSTRILSYSEVSAALDCQARWDFRYGDQLAGSSLKEKAIAPLLSGGRAWGAAVAAWHTSNFDGQAAIDAMDGSLVRDADRQREHGVYDEAQFKALRLELLQLLTHYVDTAEMVPMDPVVERELLVPLPSRSGKRASNRYKLLCYLDATSGDGDWIEEFKLRGSLTPVSLIANSRQIRWYAWARWKATGSKPKGVYVNERLHEAPKPARILQSGKVSHANQKTTAESYLAACTETSTEPDQRLLADLRARKWQQRVPVLIRDDEYAEIERELVSAAKLIQELDSGEIWPLRNVKRANCGWCPFVDICPSPDNDLVDALFERRPPKRDLPAETEQPHDPVVREAH